MGRKGRRQCHGRRWWLIGRPALALALLLQVLRLRLGLILECLMQAGWVAVVDRRSVGLSRLGLQRLEGQELGLLVRRAGSVTRLGSGSVSRMGCPKPWLGQRQGYPQVEDQEMKRYLRLPDPLRSVSLDHSQIRRLLESGPLSLEPAGLKRLELDRLVVDSLELGLLDHSLLHSVRQT